MDSKRNGEELVQIFVDADACPVVAIVGKIAKEHDLPVTLLCDTNLVTDTGSRFAGSKSELISGASSSAEKFC